MIAVIREGVRSATIDNLLSDHVRTAIAKGASPRRILARHVLRDSRKRPQPRTYFRAS